MGQESIYILKRDGSQQPYDGEKIRSAVDKAFRAAGLADEEGYALRIESLIQTELCHRNSQVAVEEIQVTLRLVAASEIEASLIQDLFGV